MIGSLRRGIPNLALLVLSGVVGLGVAETLFRSMFLKHMTPTTEQEFVQFIASSWPRPISIEKTPGTLRILGLADSFGYRGGPGNYHYRMENFLRAEDFKVEVVNFSVPGLEPKDELEVLKRFGPRYRPDLVLHGFYVGNDFQVPTGVLLDFHYNSVRSIEGLRSFLPWNFYLLRWIDRYGKAQWDRYQRAVETAQGEPRGTLSHKAFLRAQVGQTWIYRRVPDPKERWRETTQILDEIRSVTEQMGAEYVMVIHPAEFQVNPSLRDELSQTFFLNFQDYDLDLPQKFLLEYCRSRKVPCLDLLPRFRGTPSRQGFYLLKDGHYNQNGNLLAARLLSDFLQKEKLLGSLRSS